ncbi:hypothetical protein BJX99DRAFT_24408 [Aspergillus californicus]
MRHMAGTVLVTGANGSLALGFVQAFLALYPEHTLIAAVRNPAPDKDANTAKLVRLVSKYPKAKVYIEALDLGSLSGVRTFADSLSSRISSEKLPPISAIICNAFTWSLGAQKSTSDGFDATFQVSHLSHYLLVLKLLGSMDATSGRIVMLGSTAHYPHPNPLSSLIAQIPDDLEELVRPSPDPPSLVHDRGFQRYGTAKLANVIFANDLNNRLAKNPQLSNITVTAMDPGGMTSSRAHTEQKLVVRVMSAIVNLLLPILKHLTTAIRTTEDSGRDLVALSNGPTFDKKRGYYVGQTKAAPAPLSLDPEVQARLWTACWKWAGLTPEETALNP